MQNEVVFRYMKNWRGQIVLSKPLFVFLPNFQYLTSLNKCSTATSTRYACYIVSLAIIDGESTRHISYFYSVILHAHISLRLNPIFVTKRCSHLNVGGFVQIPKFRNMRMVIISSLLYYDQRDCRNFIQNRSNLAYRSYNNLNINYNWDRTEP